MDNTSTLLACSIASTGFRLIDTSVKGDAVLNENQGRIGTKYSIDCEGEVQGEDAASFASNLADFKTAILAAEGKDFSITSFGTTIFALLHAKCVDRGPTLKSFTVDKQLPSAALVKPVKFTVEGATADGADGGGDQSGQPISLQQTKTLSSEGVLSISFSGKFWSSANDTEDQFEKWRTELRKTYTPDAWVESSKKELTFSGQQLTFELSYKQLTTPITISSKKYTVRDGNLGATSTARDEHMRKVTTTTYDAILDAASDTDAFVTDVRDLINKAIKPNKILRETVDVSLTQVKKVKAVFTVLQGADGNDLLDWEQSLEAPNISAEVANPLKMLDFPGRDPIIVRDNDKGSRLTQRGRAVGVNRPPKPPLPALDKSGLEAPPIMSVRQLNSIEWETTWEYRYVFKKAPSVQPNVYATLARPTAPTFLDNPLGVKK